MLCACGVVQILLVQLPNVESSWFVSALGALVAVLYIGIAFGLGVSKGGLGGACGGLSVQPRTAHQLLGCTRCSALPGRHLHAGRQPGHANCWFNMRVPCLCCSGPGQPPWLHRRHCHGQQRLQGLRSECPPLSVPPAAAHEAGDSVAAEDAWDWLCPGALEAGWRD